VPAYRMGGNFFEESRVIQGPPVVPAPDQVGALPQPVRSGPKVATRTVPVPRANPLAAKPAPEPLKQAAAPAARPAEVQAAAPPAATTGSAPEKPAPQLAPTKEMPNVQGLE
jgi:hypothetical protein